MVKVGDKVRFIPSGSALGSAEKHGRALTGTVYYVNNAHRHYGVVAEVGTRGNTLRETFKF